MLTFASLSSSSHLPSVTKILLFSLNMGLCTFNHITHKLRVFSNSIKRGEELILFTSCISNI